MCVDRPTQRSATCPSGPPFTKPLRRPDSCLNFYSQMVANRNRRNPLRINDIKFSNRNKNHPSQSFILTVDPARIGIPSGASRSERSSPRRSEEPAASLLPLALVTYHRFRAKLARQGRNCCSCHLFSALRRRFWESEIRISRAGSTNFGALEACHRQAGATEG
jgi:hypothetical protein